MLYGFASDGERQTFRRLLKISGVGARTALAILSGLSVEELTHAVATQDGARLTRVPGIGKKTAERLLLELRDKLTTVEGSGGRHSLARSDALNALLSLGYNDKEANFALGKLAPDLSASESIRQALKLLSKTS